MYKLWRFFISIKLLKRKSLGILVLIFTVLSGSVFATTDWRTGRSMTLFEFLSQRYTPVREQWRKPPVKVYPYRAVPFLGDTAGELERQKFLEPQGNFDYSETQPEESYHDWDFCTYEDSIIGEYMPPREVEDRCCTCADGWECQFEKRILSDDDELRECEVPDLAITKFEVIDTFLTYASSQIDFEITIKNEGTKKTKNYWATITKDDEILDEVAFPGLEPNAMSELTIANFPEIQSGYTVEPGEHVFALQLTLINNPEEEPAENANLFEETNTENDFEQVTITIDAPDLAVTDAELIALPNFQGTTQEHLVVVQVRNEGKEIGQNFDLIARRQNSVGQFDQLYQDNHNRFLGEDKSEALVPFKVFLPIDDDEETLQFEVISTNYDSDPGNNLLEKVFTVDPSALPSSTTGTSGTGTSTGTTGTTPSTSTSSTGTTTGTGTNGGSTTGTGTNSGGIGSTGGISIQIEDFKSFIFLAGTPVTFPAGSTAELNDDGSGNLSTNVIRIYVDSSFGSQASVEWNLEDPYGNTLLPFEELNYSAFGYGASFQVSTLGDYVLKIKVFDPANPDDVFVWAPDFPFSVIDVE